MELIQKRIANLLTVKSIVTVILTVVFAYLAVGDKVSTDQFLTVFTVVIAFYFGTQAERKSNESVSVSEIANNASSVSEVKSDANS